MVAAMDAGIVDGRRGGGALSFDGAETVVGCGEGIGGEGDGIGGDD